MLDEVCGFGGLSGRRLRLDVAGIGFLDSACILDDARNMYNLLTCIMGSRDCQSADVPKYLVGV